MDTTTNSIVNIDTSVSSDSAKRSNLVKIWKNLEKLNDEYPRNFRSSPDFSIEDIDGYTTEYNDALDQLKKAQLRLRLLKKNMKKSNTTAWSKTLQNLTPGQLVKVRNQDTFGHVVTVDTKVGDVNIKVFNPNPPEFGERDSSMWLFHLRVIHPLTEEQKEAFALQKKKRKSTLFLYSQTPSECESPLICPKCEHRRCYTYHHYRKDSPGGEEGVCCSKTCQCKDCKKARTQGRHLDWYGCCKCHIRKGECDVYGHEWCGH